eukprot:TRINITY_DN28639_c0_g1_i8.p1 TRINITY_DN28639_c0_g1~~TRINITY_DN28639_c0_g1_i8.p1  ORF type:complete len:133 (-),score=9.01 TRINITY_DN28639_c0_g1_i8:31-429(-)
MKYTTTKLAVSIFQSCKSLQLLNQVPNFSACSYQFIQSFSSQISFELDRRRTSRNHYIHQQQQNFSKDSRNFSAQAQEQEADQSDDEDSKFTDKDIDVYPDGFPPFIPGNLLHEYFQLNTRQLTQTSTVKER